MLANAGQQLHSHHTRGPPRYSFAGTEQRLTQLQSQVVQCDKVGLCQAAIRRQTCTERSRVRCEWSCALQSALTSRYLSCLRSFIQHSHSDPRLSTCAFPAQFPRCRRGIYRHNLMLSAMTLQPIDPLSVGEATHEKWTCGDANGVAFCRTDFLLYPLFNNAR